MRKALIIIAALMIISSVSWPQEESQAQEKPPAAGAPQQQAPARQQNVKYTNDSVAHVSFIEGKTFLQRASDLGFEEGALNMPVSEGDRLGTSDGRMEVHFGRGNYIRLDHDSKVDILNLPKKGDDVARLRVWAGSIYLVVGRLAKEKAIEVHTADSSFYVLDRGVYRINVRENRDTEILVFHGLIEAAGEGGSTLVKAEQKLEVSEGRFSGKPSAFMGVADDAFDRFNQSRNSELGQQLARNPKRHLPEELGDYESELDENGQWTYLAPYGNVWVPSGVSEDWRPYYDGRWVYLDVSGWTWMPYEPWGWPTFHYGRWHWGVGLGWYWIPMDMWGPAWVNWWWDDYYYGWGPMSYWGWGYPGFYFGFNLFGGFYGGFGGWYYGGFYPPYGRYPYYPGGGRALTVIRRNQLKAPNIASVALKDPATLKSLSKMTFSAHAPNVRPSGTRISVQPMNGNRVMLRNDGSSGGLVQDRGVARPSGEGSSGTPIKREGGTQGKSTGSQGTKGGSGKSAPARSSGSSKSSGSGARKIRKEDVAGGAPSGVAGYRSSSALASGSSLRTYPSSPMIHGPSTYYGDGGEARARSFSGGGYYRGSWRGIYGSYPSTRSGGYSSGRVAPRSGKSSGRSYTGRSSSSSSRSSSGSHSSGGRRR